MRHDFKNLGTLPWASLGLPYEAAKTDYKCKRCGVKFAHYYHKEHDIYKALKDAEIDFEGCKEKEDADERDKKE